MVKYNFFQQLLIDLLLLVHNKNSINDIVLKFLKTTISLALLICNYWCDSNATTYLIRGLFGDNIRTRNCWSLVNIHMAP